MGPRRRSRRHRRWEAEGSGSPRLPMSPRHFPSSFVQNAGRRTTSPLARTTRDAVPGDAAVHACCASSVGRRCRIRRCLSSTTCTSAYDVLPRTAVNARSTAGSPERPLCPSPSIVPNGRCRPLNAACARHFVTRRALNPSRDSMQSTPQSQQQHQKISAEEDRIRLVDGDRGRRFWPRWRLRRPAILLCCSLCVSPPAVQLQQRQHCGNHFEQADDWPSRARKTPYCRGGPLSQPLEGLT